MGNNITVGSIQDAVMERFRAISVTNDNGAMRFRSFSDGGQLDPRVGHLHTHFEEHRYSLDNMTRVRYMRTSCATIPEEDIVSWFGCLHFFGGI